jgi:integrase
VEFDREDDMPRPKTGAAILKWRIANGKRVKEWYACVSYTDDTGKRQQWTERAMNKTAAKSRATEMLAELADETPASIEGRDMTFAQLADYYKETYLLDPEYRDGRKIAGLRSKYDYQKRLKPLREFFDRKKLRSITHGDLQRYRTHRLKVPVILGRNTKGTDKKGKPREKPRSIATVHRELSLMRRILNVAVSNSWIVRNPFHLGESLIRPGEETPRERIISREEEQRLLAACEGERQHLRAILICALDTGMRRGEIFSLTWSDIDFESGLITIRAFNTKTMRERQVALTERLAIELECLTANRAGELVFGIKTHAQHSFDKAKKKAGLADLRFHDLRHTHATRLVGAQMPLAEVGRVLGHTQPSTTFRYVNINADTARRAADLLNQFNNIAVEDEQTTIN